MPPVEPFDIREVRTLGFLPRVKPPPTDEFGLQSFKEALDNSVVPTIHMQLIERRRPRAASGCQSARSAYELPPSGRNIGPPSTRRCCLAMVKAACVRIAGISSAMAQPTIRGESRATSTARSILLPDRHIRDVPLPFLIWRHGHNALPHIRGYNRWRHGACSPGTASDPRCLESRGAASTATLGADSHTAHLLANPDGFGDSPHFWLWRDERVESGSAEPDSLPPIDSPATDTTHRTISA